MKRADAERELGSGKNSKEIEASKIFGELPHGGGVPVTENLSEKIAAARKRVGLGRQSAQEDLPIAP